MDDVVADDRSLEEIERAFALVVRRAGLPRLHEQITAKVGVPLERAAYPVLRRVGDEGPLRVTDLACALAVDLSTASRQIAQLETAGLVERQPDPADGRASRVGLTAEGRRVLAEVRRAWRSILTELVAGWKPKERADLACLLAKLADALGVYTGQTPRTRGVAAGASVGTAPGDGAILPRGAKR